MIDADFVSPLFWFIFGTTLFLFLMGLFTGIMLGIIKIIQFISDKMERE
jgi:hypothetical protein